jgi:hypothetical protein
VVEYQDREVLFTSPRVLAVMAAPPSYKDVPMDLGSAGTTFGKGTGSGAQSEQSLGFTVGFSVGVEADGLFASGSVKTSVEAAMDWVSSQSKEITKTYYYSGTADSDKVVFTTIPFDVYHYKVLSAPDPAAVGTTMVVNVPREPKTLYVDRAFFNANNGSFTDIGSDVLAHTIGDPRSYPREADLNKASLALYSDETMTVGQGSGSQTIELSVVNTKTKGKSFDLNVKVEAEVSAGNRLVKGTAGVSGGFHYGFSYSISTSDTTVYSGTVGNILDGADWAKRRFDFGLYVQPTTIEGQKFPLIGYWVD